MRVGDPETARRLSVSDRTSRDAGEIQATPLARSLAEHLDIDLETLEVESAQITEHDVRAAAEARAVEARLVPTSVSRLGDEAASTVRPGRMTATVVLSDGPRSFPSETESVDRVVGATALALRCHPTLNAHLVRGDVLAYDVVNVALSGATEGVSTVVIGQADALNVAQISAERRRLEDIAATRDVRSWDMPEGTFSVSFLSSPVITSYAPSLRPPYVAVLGVRPSGELASDPDPRMAIELSLVYDGRAVDDHDAAGFLADVIQALGSHLEPEVRPSGN